jgi:hypothetical protein
LLLISLFNQGFNFVGIEKTVKIWIWKEIVWLSISNGICKVFVVKFVELWICMVFVLEL